ncbi:MAG: hypothetical protein FJY77_05440 [Candidatus Altiarchaeales archaeon]|nr:hypothetical protein [Candidatus Altiarchaeales archaeon]
MHYPQFYIITFLAFLIVVYYTLRLVRETKYEKYWIFLLISALFLGVHHLAGIPYLLGMMDEHTLKILEDSGAVLGSLSLAYAAYGLSKTMREIRERFPKE